MDGHPVFHNAVFCRKPVCVSLFSHEVGCMLFNSTLLLTVMLTYPPATACSCFYYYCVHPSVNPNCHVLWPCTPQLPSTLSYLAGHFQHAPSHSRLVDKKTFVSAVLGTLGIYECEKNSEHFLHFVYSSRQCNFFFSQGSFRHFLPFTAVYMEY